VQTTDEIDQMMRQLARLSRRERLAIHAFFLEDQDADQAAALLGISRSGLYAMVERGLTRLAALVGRTEARGRGAK
jgi:DNA-directed RNA polymerase specialized sigma subunit